MKKGKDLNIYMEKTWVIKPRGDERLVDELARELTVDKDGKPEDKQVYNIISNLLVQRGIKDYESAKDFFRPSLSKLHDPYLLNDMDIAVERILFAQKGSEKILVYGDYDVDGTSAVALVYSYLETFCTGVEFYIPDRYTEGYGVSYQSIDWALENGVKLIIALDCGIKAIEQVKYAKERGIDFIICDHHLPSEELPDACAILNPKRLDSTYPYKELSGCGIGFKLIHAINNQRNQAFEKLHHYLDLVAISIAADVVPITGENRILAFFGLKVINKMPRPGLEAILEYSKVLHVEDNLPFYFNRELSLSDLVFLVGPRINAAGRIETGKHSVELLICKKKEEAAKIAKQINNNNDQRRKFDIEATEQALEMIDTLPEYKNSKSTVVYNKDWNKGVVGIVASRLIEKCYKPTIVFTKSNGHITGSARSVKDFDIYAAIESCSHLLEHFGGHKFAAGLSLKEENLEEFKRLFEKQVEENISDKQSQREIDIDMQISLSDISPKLFRILNQFSPFGPENSIPVFQSNNVVDTGLGRPVGANHLKLNVLHLNVRHNPFACIGFGLSSYYKDIRGEKPFDICYQIDENLWNGKTSLQLKLMDIRINN